MVLCPIRSLIASEAAEKNGRVALGLLCVITPFIIRLSGHAAKRKSGGHCANYLA
jgi:hypothetical protein